MIKANVARKQQQDYIKIQETERLELIKKFTEIDTKKMESVLNQIEEKIRSEIKSGSNKEYINYTMPKKVSMFNSSLEYTQKQLNRIVEKHGMSDDSRKKVVDILKKAGYNISNFGQYGDMKLKIEWGVK